MHVFPEFRNGTVPETAGGMPCYKCGTPCVYKSIELLFIMGVIANLLVIVCVINDKRLRKPTYVTLACLAMADCMFLILNLTVTIDIVMKAFSCVSFKISEDYFSTLVGACWCSANGHLTLMSIVRYVLLVHPLKAHTKLTIKRVIIMSIIIWLISVSLYVIVGVLQDIDVFAPKNSDEAVFFVWCISFFIPFLSTAFLHAVKLYKVRKATRNNSTVGRQSSVDRMSKIIVIILILAFFLPIPKLCNAVMVKCGYKYHSDMWKMHIQHISVLLFLLNSAINPMIYAFMSPAIRRSLVSLLPCKIVKEMARGISAIRTSIHSSTLTTSPCRTRVNERLSTVSLVSSAVSVSDVPGRVGGSEIQTNGIVQANQTAAQVIPS